MNYSRRIYRGRIVQLEHTVQSQNNLLTRGHSPTKKTHPFRKRVSIHSTWSIKHSSVWKGGICQISTNIYRAKDTPVKMIQGRCWEGSICTHQLITVPEMNTPAVDNVRDVTDHGWGWNIEVEVTTQWCFQTINDKIPTIMCKRLATSAQSLTWCSNSCCAGWVYISCILSAQKCHWHTANLLEAGRTHWALANSANV